MERSFLGYSQPLRKVSSGTSLGFASLRASLAVLLIGAALATGSAAFAGDEPGTSPSGGAPSDADKARAKELFDNGQILYDEGRYDDAVTAWQESYRLSGYPDLLFNISNAYERAGKYTEALDTLNKYRAYASADERATLDRRIAGLQERKAAQDAEAARIAALQAQTTTTTTTTTTTPTPTTPPPKTGGGVQALPIALLSTGAVGLGVGGVFAAGAAGAMGDIKDQCVPADGGGYLCPTAASTAADARGQKATISAVALGVGGAFAIGGVVAAIAGNGASDGDVSFGPLIGGDGAGITMSGRF
jgi:hypothetical protein